MNWQLGVCHFIHHWVEIFYPFISCNGKRRGLVLTHKSCVSPPPNDLLLVCTCEMMGSSVWLRTQIYGIISQIMDIEDISYYSFTVRNMTRINSNLCARAIAYVWCARWHVGLLPHMCTWEVLLRDRVMCFRGFLTSCVCGRSCLSH